MTDFEGRRTRTNSVYWLPFFNTASNDETWPSYCWLPCNATILVWWAYPSNYCGYGYLVTTRVLHSNNWLQSNTSQYISSLCIDHTGPGTHSASYPTAIRGLPRGGGGGLKRPLLETDLWHLSAAGIKNCGNIPAILVWFLLKCSLIKYARATLPLPNTSF
jgi:hypothetical protein